MTGCNAASKAPTPFNKIPMILPSDSRCVTIVKELDGEPMLTQWEADFISSNRNRTSFSSAQKEVFQRLEEKYEI